MTLYIVSTIFDIWNTFNVKDPILRELRALVIYKFPCSSSNTWYVGLARLLSRHFCPNSCIFQSNTFSLTTSAWKEWYISFRVFSFLFVFWMISTVVISNYSNDSPIYSCNWWLWLVLLKKKCKILKTICFKIAYTFCQKLTTCKLKKT